MTPALDELAWRYFRLRLPVTLGQLKLAYRTAAKALHSDVGGSDAAFVQMKAAYDQLLPLATVVDDGPIKERELCTVDDVPLSQLGLGRKDNGRRCDECEGRGYHVRHDWTDARPAFYGLCPGCRGTGRFWLRNRRRLVRCRRCGGLGIVNVVVRPQKEVTTYTRCYICDGAGEVAVFNPVLLKGAILGRK